ncbi:unnamed protein product [Caenorhabditis auriculariae]|uniref:Uncharacterized protein n=1 Tax=Caenorhabditis auriculariae TaxID=2777116 RepID=A0A8S1HK92_9PELO|nr:unnamed protein product [Caenorhabditis auriculariae]
MSTTRLRPFPEAPPVRRATRFSCGNTRPPLRATSCGFPRIAATRKAVNTHRNCLGGNSRVALRHEPFRVRRLFS